MKEDYLKKDLPKNRKEDIVYILKYRKNVLFQIILFSLPFTIPFFAYLIFSRYFIEGYINLPTDVFLNSIIRNFPNLFFVFLLGAGLSGVFYTLRKLIFMEPVKVSYHFFKGIKDSGFEFGLFCFIYFVIYLLFDILKKYILVFKNSNVILYLLINIIIILILMFLLYILIYILASSSLYIVSFNAAIKDAFKNGFMSFFKSFSIFILLFSPYILLYLSNISYSSIMNLSGTILICFTVTVLSTMVVLSDAYDKFDININKVSYPELYKKGLYVEE